MKIIVIVFALLLSAGCVSNQKLGLLDLNMTKSEVSATLGNYGTTRGAITNKYNQKVEVLEYILYDNMTGLSYSYLLYFCEDRLVQWGKAGDWEPDQVYDITFREDKAD
jgi:hypothetical protein